MKRLLIGCCLTVSALFVSGCGSSGSAPADAGVQPQEASGERPASTGAPWFEVQYFFAGDEVPQGECSEGSLRLDGDFNYTFQDCRGTKTGELTPAQLKSLEAAWRDASGTLNSELICENVGISAEMSLSIQRTSSSASEVLRSFDSEEDCTRGSLASLERLDNFMAELFNQLSN